LEDPALLLDISPANPEPLYLQIVKEVRRRVADGTWPPGMLLPSFRDLAAKLLVSVITVKRAYDELEREGVIVRHQGLGTYVAEEGMDAGRSAKWERARALLGEALREAREAGRTDAEVAAELRRQVRDGEARKEKERWKAPRSASKA
jgi:GntR family transcriptional regulator